MTTKEAKQGAFLSVEGVDGAGKTTQLDFIEQTLADADIEVIRTREPGGTILGEQLRQILLNGAEINISEEAELLMMFAARQQHLQEIIIPAIKAGKWILTDRFTDASYAYQGGGRGITFERIAALEQWVQQGLEPDLTLMLDVEVELGISRSQDRGEEEDRFEREAITFKQAVRNAYRQRANAHPKRIQVIDASGDIESVQKQIKQILGEFIKSYQQ